MARYTKARRSTGRRYSSRGSRTGGRFVRGSSRGSGRSSGRQQVVKLVVQHAYPQAQGAVYAPGVPGTVGVANNPAPNKRSIF